MRSLGAGSWAGCLLGAALLLCASPRPACALPPDTWLVTIGNNRGEPGDLELLYAQRDAEEVAEVLRSLGGVASHRILRLVDEDAQSVRTALLRLHSEIRARTGERPSALVVFYSGHADADALHLGDSRLPFNELRELVRGSPATMRLLIVDACRAGGVSRVKGAHASQPFTISAEANLPEGLAIITSSAAGEDSQESDSLRGSFFSHHLVNGLRGAADHNSDDEVTLAEAYAYAYAETVRSSGRTLDLQHPTYAWDVRGRGDLVMTRLSNDDGAGRLVLADPVVYLIHEGSEAGSLTAEVRAKEPNMALSLPARHYRVQERRAREYRSYDVRLHAGQSVRLADLNYHSLRYDRLVRKGGGNRDVVHGALLMGGARGELVAGEGIAPQLILGYSAALQAFTFEARLRFATSTAAAREEITRRRHNEYGVGVTLQRFVDLSWASIAFGVLVDVALHEQRFQGDGPSTRRSTAVGLAPLGAIERVLHAGLSVRLEGGPLTTIFRGGDVVGGRATSASLRTELDFWIAGGLLQRF